MKCSPATDTEQHCASENCVSGSDRRVMDLACSPAAVSTNHCCYILADRGARGLGVNGRDIHVELCVVLSNSTPNSNNTAVHTYRQKHTGVSGWITVSCCNPLGIQATSASGS